MNLRTFFLMTMCFILFAGAPVTAVEAPSEVGGFKLGDDISEYLDFDANYLKEVVVNDWHGFRKGIIYYGTCAYPGQIVRIRMKYEDSSKTFYYELLKRFKQKYGKPNEWKGDAFGVLYVWKWQFFNSDNERVTLILQHNLQNHSETIGNQVKLSYSERLEEERLCFIEYCETSMSSEEQELIKQRMKPDWDHMIPR